MKTFHGRLWCTNDQWHFQEAGTGIHVFVPTEKDSLQIKDYFARLLTAMNAEYTRRRQSDRAKHRAQLRQGDRPQTPGDMSVKGTSRNGKKIYSWADAGRGRIEVEVTPRALRSELEPDASKHRAALARESGD